MYNATIKQVGYGCISVASVLGNALVILFFLHQRSRLQKPYSIMICSLAVADFIAGIFVFFTPGYVFLTPLYEPTSALALQFYCRLVRVRVFFFLFGYASIYICLFLAIDRWFAVVKPTKYKQALTRTRSLLGLVVAYAVAAFLVYLESPSLRVAPRNPAGRRCIALPIIPSDPAHKIKVIIAFIMKGLLPFSLIVVLYAHLVYTLKTKPVINPQDSVLTKRVTILAALATTALIITWMPMQVTFVLIVLFKTTGVTKSSVHRFLSLLAVFNSCVNPVLYGLASKEYRKGYWEVLTKLFLCFKCIVHQRNERRVGTSHNDHDAPAVENGTVGNYR